MKKYSNPTGYGLLIAEKPSAMNTIKDVYFKIKDKLSFTLDFACCAGHLIGLAEPGSYREDWGKPYRKEVLPIIPTDCFPDWHYVILNQKFYDPIAEKINNNHYDFILNAGDAGREGELIQKQLYKYLNINAPIYRFWADDLSDATIEKTLLNLIPDSEFKNLTDAAFLREYSDDLVGINFSRAATLALDRKSILGRVMTAVLALVVRREAEIKSFVPTTYYHDKVIFNNSGSIYNGYLINGTPIQDLPRNRYAFKNKNEIHQLMNGVKQGSIVKRKEEPVFSYAPHLFNLTDLQKICAKKYGYDPKTTLSIAQSLYEKKLLSYPRTESRFLTSASSSDSVIALKKLAILPEFAPFITNIFGNKEYMAKILSSKKYINDKKVSDHPALIPTGIVPDFSTLSEKEITVFKLVLKRLIAIFMPPYVLNVTTVITQCESLLFETKGIKLAQIGWKELYPEDSKPDESGYNDKIPPDNTDKTVTIVKYEIEEKETTPPSSYTYELLLQDMEFVGKKITNENYIDILKECSGLGTPATRAEIIDKLLRYKYLVKNKKYITPTAVGTDLINSLNGFDIVSPELTAKWELALKKVENGELDYDTYYDNICSYVRDQTAKLLTLQPLGAYHYTISDNCPVCKIRPIYYAEGWNYAICSGRMTQGQKDVPDCKFVLPRTFCGVKFSEDEMKEMLYGGSSRATTFKLKNGKNLYCSMHLDNNGKLKPILIPIGTCPKCGGTVVRGTKSYYCVNNMKKDESGEKLCDFSVFNKVGLSVVSDVSMKEILANGRTSKPYMIKYQSGKNFTGLLTLSPDYKKISPVEMQPVPIVSCPFCDNGTIMENACYYFCNHFPPTGTCNFRLSKQYMGAKISKTDLKRLISGQTIKKKVTFKDKNTAEKIIKYDISEHRLKW